MKFINYFITDESGVVTQSGRIPEGDVQLQEPPEGHSLHMGFAIPSKQRLVDGALVDYERPKAYDERRREQYPLVGDQLDAIWKYLAAQQPKNLPDDTAAMLEQILSVKDANPKEIENV